MVNETLVSDPVLDPLSGFVGVSLLPTTIRASSEALDPKDLESVHKFMKSTEVKGAGKNMEEAEAIVGNGTELLDNKFGNFVQSMGIDEDLAMKPEEKLQERRPGLGRKRARFKLKPSTSQAPVINIGPSLDLDKLTDPVEFFAAAEKLEVAEREMKRLQGIHDPEVNILPTYERRRRPGLLRSKTARYKFHPTYVQLENDDTSILSQETLGRDVLADQNSQLLQEPHGVNVESQEADLTGSIQKTENRVNKIYDELLSSNGGDLEERLQIKPINLDSFRLPDFRMTEKTDGKALEERIKNPKKFSLDIQDLVKRTTEGTPSTFKQHEQSPANNTASPTPPKSSHASLSLLRKRIFQSNPLRDPFSPLNIDLDNNDLQSDHPPHQSQRIDKDVGPAESYWERENLAGYDNTSIAVPLRGSDSSHDQLMEKNSGRDNVDIGQNESRSELEQHNGYDDISDVNLNMKNMGSHHQSDGLDKVKDVSDINNVLKDQQGPATKSPVDCGKMQDEEVLVETQPSLQAQGEAGDTANCSIGTAVEDFGSTEIDRQLDNMLPETPHSAEQDHHVEDYVKDLNSDLLDSVAVEVDSTNVGSKLPDLSPQRRAQTKDRRQKAKRPAGARREFRALSSRPSIADAGTSFENGVRRSKRMKTRPLEFWKGERLLYERVGKSLKLVGLQYFSPSQGSLKVKSYISDVVQ